MPLRSRLRVLSLGSPGPWCRVTSYPVCVPASSAQLAQLGDRFITVLNSRDLAAAANLYSAQATYSSVALVEQGIADGRIVGRDRIFDYFARSSTVTTTSASHRWISSLG